MQIYLCEEKHKLVYMTISGWTVRETLTKSICNFREHYHADFLEIHAEYFFLRTDEMGFYAFTFSWLLCWVLGEEIPS